MQPLQWYDPNAASKAIMLKYDMSEYDVFGILNSLIKMMHNEDLRVVTY